MAAADETLAGSLGVAPRVIATARRGLTEGIHWTQDERGRVKWLPAGVDALRASLELPVVEKIEGDGGLDPARPTRSLSPSTMSAAQSRSGCGAPRASPSAAPSGAASNPTAPSPASLQPSLPDTCLHIP